VVDDVLVTRFEAMELATRRPSLVGLDAADAEVEAVLGVGPVRWRREPTLLQLLVGERREHALAGHRVDTLDLEFGVGHSAWGHEFLLLFFCGCSGGSTSRSPSRSKAADNDARRSAIQVSTERSRSTFSSHRRTLPTLSDRMRPACSSTCTCCTTAAS